MSSIKNIDFRGGGSAFLGYNWGGLKESQWREKYKKRTSRVKKINNERWNLKTKQEKTEIPKPWHIKCQISFKGLPSGHRIWYPPVSGIPWHSTAFLRQTEEVLDRGTGPSDSSVQPVHTGPDSGTEKPDGGKPHAHSDAHLNVQPNITVIAQPRRYSCEKDFGPFFFFFFKFSLFAICDYFRSIN